MISNQDWLVFNKNRRYPIKTGLSGGVGSKKLPNDFIVEAIFAEVPKGDYVYLSNVKRVGQKITVTFSTITSGELIPIVIDGNSHTEFKSYTGTGASIFGLIVVGSIETMLTRNLAGGVSYGPNETELEPRVLQFSSASNSVTSISSKEQGIKLTGDVELRAGVGLRLTTIEGDNAIMVSLDTLDDTPEDCNCPPNYPFVRTINGMHPDCNGNFCINAGGINVVQTDGNCLNITTAYQPNQLCLIEVGTPGPAGPQGPQGATKPGGGGICCEVAADPSCCESCVESCIDSCAGDPACEESCCGSCMVSCGGPCCPPSGIVWSTLSLCVDENKSNITDLISWATVIEAQISNINLGISSNATDIDTNSTAIGSLIVSLDCLETERATHRDIISCIVDSTGVNCSVPSPTTC